MTVKKLTDNEKAEVVENCKSTLFNAGFDNVVILANEGGTHGTIRISSRTRSVLFRVLLATFFMDDCVSKMLKEDSEGRKVWEILCSSILKTISPQIREMENEMKEENKTPHTEVIPFHSFPKD